MKKYLLILTTFFSLTVAHGQTWVTIPDTHFVTYLQSIVPTAMHGDSLNISSTLVTTTTHQINVHDKGIADLTGVQYFSSLDTLNFTNTGTGPFNTVSNIPALANSLTYLSFYANHVSSLPTLPNTLAYLNCGANNFSNLPALPTSLKFLNCSFNNLTTLPALPSTLTYLNCFHNHLPNLPTLGSLITYLSCGDNHILTSLPSLPNSLITLECGANDLTSLPVLPNSLQALICNNNPLMILPALPNSVYYLDCGSDSLTSLPTLPNSLLTLGCVRNSLTSLPTLPNLLINLDCELNSLTSLPVLPDFLTSLFCDSNNIACFPVFPNSLVNTNYFNIASNPYNCLPNYIAAMSAADLAKPLCTAGNSNGCPVAGINELTFNNQITVYPNPTNDNFIIETNTKDKLFKDATLTIYNSFGQQVKLIKNISGQTITLHRDNLPSGMYFLQLIQDNKTFATDKLLIIDN